jgi:Uma2 family endonuclease
MKAVMLEVPAALLDQRREAGLDKADEMWEGVLHMVPPPGGRHQRFSTRLLLVLAPLAVEVGLEPLQDATGLYAADDDWRVPDQQYVRPEHLSDRGTEGAELVVEVRSPGDEAMDKLPWYAAVGVHEVLLVDPVTYRADLHRLAEGQQVHVPTDPSGAVSSAVLGCTFASQPGGLRVSWKGGQATVSG